MFLKDCHMKVILALPTLSSFTNIHFPSQSELDSFINRTPESESPLESIAVAEEPIIALESDKQDIVASTQMEVEAAN